MNWKKNASLCCIVDCIAPALLVSRDAIRYCYLWYIIHCHHHPYHPYRVPLLHMHHCHTTMTLRASSQKPLSSYPASSIMFLAFASLARPLHYQWHHCNDSPTKYCPHRTPRVSGHQHQLCHLAMEFMKNGPHTPHASIDKDPVTISPFNL